MELDSNPSCFDMSSTVSLNRGALSSRCIGQLYLRLARLSPGSEDFNQHPKPDISVIKAGEYSTACSNHHKFRLYAYSVMLAKSLCTYTYIACNTYVCHACTHLYNNIDMHVSHIARRLYGGKVPWKGDGRKTEDEATRQRYVHMCICYVVWITCT